MTEDSITVQILRDIRDEIHQLRADTNSRIDQLGSRIADTNAGLDIANARLSVISTTLVEQNTQLVMLTRYVGSSRTHVDRELAELDERVTRLEKS